MIWGSNLKIKKTIFIAVLAAFLSAVSGATSFARPPTDSWSANLNKECKPYDVVDWLRSVITAETFWREQQKDFTTFVKAATTNLLNARLLLKENREGIGDFRNMVVKKAAEMGKRGAKAREMVKENMEDWDAIAATFRENIKIYQAELLWAKKCLAAASGKLRDMGIVEIGQ